MGPGLLAGRAVGADDRGLQGDDLPVEPALGHGPGRFAGTEAQPVDVLAGDPVLLGDPLGRAELVGHVPGESSGLDLPGPLKALAPRPTRLMASTPQAIPTSMAPR